MTPALGNEAAEQEIQLGGDDSLAMTADQLADLIEKDPAAIRALRQLILEGLESGEEGEVNEEWWLTMAEGVRERAAARHR